MNVYEVIRRPLITEKGHAKREAERTLCFEVHPNANKIQIKQAVETVFKVKVSDVRTGNFAGSCVVVDVFPAMRPIGKRLTYAWRSGKKCRNTPIFRKETTRHANKEF